MMLQNNIKIFPTPSELTEGAAHFIVALAQKIVAEKGRFTISLSGGHTPEQLYALLADEPYVGQMPWSDTYVFWGDERCVGLDDKDNNAHMARVQMLDHVAIPAGNIYPMPVDLTPAKAADRYEETIRHFFGDGAPVFDLILLGLGENGHTASLFPDTDVVIEARRLVKEVFVEEQNMFRITMTAPLINQASNIMFLVQGKGKAEILNTVLNTPPRPDKYPAQLIAIGMGNLYWYIDEDAAMILQQDVN